MKYELKAYSLGETIGQGFNLYFDNFISLVKISFIANIPAIILGLEMQNIVLSGNLEDTTMLIGLSAITVILNLIINIFLSGVIIQIISKKYLNEKVSSQDYLANILPLVLPLIGLALLQGLGIIAGFMVFVIPGILLALGWSVATQVLVVEKTGIVNSLGRSWSLTTGSKGNILGLFILLGIILFILHMIAETFINGISSLLQISPTAYVVLGNVAGIVINPVMSCTLVVLYFNLRVEKEGFNIEHLADQFQITSTTEQ